MILEVAMLQIKPGLSNDFEKNFITAEKIVSAINGFISLSLKKCLEVENKYILLIKWETLESHTIGFRTSEVYNDWKALLHHFYDPFPTVEHYVEVIL